MGTHFGQRPLRGTPVRARRDASGQMRYFSSIAAQLCRRWACLRRWSPHPPAGGQGVVFLPVCRSALTPCCSSPMRYPRDDAVGAQQSMSRPHIHPPPVIRHAPHAPSRTALPPCSTPSRPPPRTLLLWPPRRSTHGRHAHLYACTHPCAYIHTCPRTHAPSSC